jgi:hypothetical protein
MKRIIRAAVLSAASAGIIAGSLGLTGMASASTSTLTATTTATGRDDSGTAGNWATDNFTRTATLTGHGVVDPSHCPGIGAGLSCHYLTGTIADKGHFTTVPGDTVPGTGSLNGQPAPQIGTAVTGAMKGSAHFAFYSDEPVSAASASNVPSSVTNEDSTSHWAELFFAPGTANFWDTSGNPGGAEITTNGWTYTAALDSDPACPNVSGRWIDASYNNYGGDPVDGNILAPAASSC